MCQPKTRISVQLNSTANWSPPLQHYGLRETQALLGRLYKVKLKYQKERTDGSIRSHGKPAYHKKVRTEISWVTKVKVEFEAQSVSSTPRKVEFEAILYLKSPGKFEFEAIARRVGSGCVSSRSCRRSSRPSSISNASRARQSLRHRSMPGKFVGICGGRYSCTHSRI